jgi:hypothetical protein
VSLGREYAAEMVRTQHASIATTQRPRPLTKLSREFRHVRRRRTTRPDGSKPARLQEFLPRSIPITTISIGPTPSSTSTTILTDRGERGGPSHNHKWLKPLNPFRVRLSIQGGPRWMGMCRASPRNIPSYAYPRARASYADGPIEPLYTSPSLACFYSAYLARIASLLSFYSTRIRSSPKFDQSRSSDA